MKKFDMDSRRPIQDEEEEEEADEDEDSITDSSSESASDSIPIPRMKQMWPFWLLMKEVLKKSLILKLFKKRMMCKDHMKKLKSL